MPSTRSTTSGIAQEKNPMRRTTTSATVESDASAPGTAVQSPMDSPRHSASSTSLSSLSSVDAAAEKKSNEPVGKLVDTYGNTFEIPDFTIKDIHDAIPKHCFERSALRSLSYVARDMVLLATTFYVFHNYVTPEYIPSKPARAGLWAIYTVLQGLFGTGIWVLAHECGHQAFSPSKTINNTVGWILHSSLLVPYFSWQM